MTYYTLAEAAERMDVSPDHLKAAVYFGHLRGKRTGPNGGGRYLFRGADLDAWRDRHMAP
ncbi:hypothetical protein JCM18899A_19060 [Nocardioides sp. AN3]